eukprot:GGOE01002558.1.p1 GENE.GGOE01002558.1~~GGOE01002558.1.p1  ORF type:complete len:360 (-),score=96.55 GGOE01002558.1:66-1145(-)
MAPHAVDWLAVAISFFCLLGLVAAGAPRPCRPSELASVLQESGTWITRVGHTPVWEPRSCFIPNLPHTETARCLAQKRIAILGDSTSRRLFKCLMFHITKRQRKGEDVVMQRQQASQLNANNALFCYCHIYPEAGRYTYRYHGIAVDWFWQENLSEEGPHTKLVLDGKYDIVLWMGGYYSYVVDYHPPDNRTVHLNVQQWEEDVRFLQKLRKAKPNATIVVVGMSMVYFWQPRQHIWDKIAWPTVLDTLYALQLRDVPSFNGIFLPMLRMTSSIPTSRIGAWMFDWIHYRGEVVNMAARILIHSLCGEADLGDPHNYVPAMPMRDCRLAYRVPYAARWWNTSRSDTWRIAASRTNSSAT